MEIPFSQCSHKFRTTIPACCAFDSRSFTRRRSPISLPKFATITKISTVSGEIPRPEKMIRFKTKEKTGSPRPSDGGGILDEIEKLVSEKKYREALEVFEVLEITGCYAIGARTLDALVSACVGSNSVREVKRVSEFISRSGFELDLHLKNRVLFMHVKLGMMIDARKLFDEMPERDSVSWITMISGLVGSGEFDAAFRLFLIMWEEFSSEASPHIFATAIQAISGLGIVTLGRQIHSAAVKTGLVQNPFVSCTLINMYSKCGFIEEARLIFEELPEKTTVAWNSVIAAHALHDEIELALGYYYTMRESGTKMDQFTLSIVIKLSARTASLEHARRAHADLVSHGFELDTVANTALVDLYGKWGRVSEARHVFDKTPAKNVATWNAMIAAYANRGMGIEAVKLFKTMKSCDLCPNHVTFLAVLSGCSYSGLSDLGWEIFRSMEEDYSIKPRAMHYACMIEILGREGRLSEAHEMIRSAPFEPKVNMWAALLTACRIHGDLELGRLTAEQIYGMEPEKLNGYLVLLNIYKASGRFEEADRVVQTMKRKGLRILPACTWIEIKKKTHFFMSGDKTHLDSGEIYRKVDELTAEIKKLGYVPDQSSSFLPDVVDHDDDDDDRHHQHHRTVYHSERLAIAFGLIGTAHGTPLQIVQGHRVCNDCHSAIKLIALVAQREFVLRDGSRFHHFKDGHCSCGDYW